MSTTLRLLSCAMLLCASLAASAHTLLYGATLRGADEVLANDSPGFGAAIVTIDLDLLTMRVQSIFAGLEGSTTAAHIHCCTAAPGTGPAGVATAVPSFPGFPLGVTTGTFDATFDLSDAASYNPQFVTAQGGNLGDALNALLAGLDAGTAYFNIHTDVYPAGEIRGFLTSPAPVPVPAAGWLLGSALGALAWRRRRA